MDKKTFGERLKAFRTEKGLTQEELANKLYVSKKAISKWETGRGLPDVALLPHLATALGVTMEELYDGKKENAPPSYYQRLHEQIDEQAIYARAYRKRGVWLMVWRIVAVVLAAVLIVVGVTAGKYYKAYQASQFYREYTLCWRNYWYNNYDLFGLNGAEPPYAKEKYKWHSQTYTEEELHQTGCLIEAEKYAVLVIYMVETTYKANGDVYEKRVIAWENYNYKTLNYEDITWNVNDFPSQFMMDPLLPPEINGTMMLGRNKLNTAMRCRVPGYYTIEYKIRRNGKTDFYCPVRVSIPEDDREALTMKFTTYTSEGYGDVIRAQAYDRVPLGERREPRLLKGEVNRNEVSFGYGTVELLNEQGDVVYTGELTPTATPLDGNLFACYENPQTGWGYISTTLASSRNQVFPMRIEFIGSKQYRDIVMPFYFYNLPLNA
ncbi:MAG: helix-turn-helix transcriptional regulator [Clostridia bacterium]|nr:helix-turn-helix transcriptional regulator [Clostridia bacterium]